MKSMIKTLAFAAVMSLSSVVMAEDVSYLYWMSDGADKFGDDWSTAKVVYRDGTAGSVSYLGAGTAFSATDAIGGDFYGMQLALGSTTLKDSYQFALELLDGDTSVAMSSWLAYSPNYIGGESMPTSEAVFHFWQVPEPTSGLLAMLGFGLLALRRKQKKA